MKMPNKPLPLSAIAEAINDALHWYFDGQIIKIEAEIMDVKKYPHKRWCFLKFVEKQGPNLIAEMKGVAWNVGYPAILKFEQETKQTFADGLQVVCDVMVKHHAKFGLSLEIVNIDVAHTIGKVVLEREQTLVDLVKNLPHDIIKIDEQTYRTSNQQLAYPKYIKRIALITAANSDGQRDFLQELQQNAYGYTFEVTEFLTIIQGDQAAKNIVNELGKIAQRKDQFDIVAIVRGGGSATDFKPFDTYDVAAMIATFPLPILTGIGHDRNVSVADMMATMLKTPTKVANYIVNYNYEYEQNILNLVERIELLAERKIQTLQDKVLYLKRILNTISLDKNLQRGFAVVYKDDQIITEPTEIKKKDELTIQLKKSKITVTVKNIVHE